MRWRAFLLISTSALASAVWLEAGMLPFKREQQRDKGHKDRQLQLSYSDDLSL